MLYEDYLLQSNGPRIVTEAGNIDADGKRIVHFSIYKRDGINSVNLKLTQTPKKTSVNEPK